MLRQWIAPAIVWIALASPLVRAADPPPDQRLAVPNSSKQTPVFNAIRSEYKTDYAQPAAADQLALCRKFREEARRSSEDPVRQYVLLREARDLAVNAGDLDEAFSVIDEMARLFRVDANGLKGDAIAGAMDRARIPPLQLMDQYLKITDAALSDGDLQMALQSMALANRIAASSREPSVKSRVKQMDLRVHDARRQLTAIVSAANKLKLKPEDPEANLLVGRYLCFIRGGWDEGLPLLAKGNDKTLATLAQKDLAHPADAKAQFDLANTWWNLPDTKDTPQRRSHQRAAYWYQQALPQLQGQSRTVAEQRLKQTEQTQ